MFGIDLRSKYFLYIFLKRCYFLLVLEIGIYVVVKLDKLLMDGVYEVIGNE